MARSRDKFAKYKCIGRSFIRRALRPTKLCKLKGKGMTSMHVKHFDCHFNATLRSAAYQAARSSAAPAQPNNLDTLVSEFEVIAEFKRNSPNDATLTSSSGKPVFDPDDSALLDFLSPGIWFWPDNTACIQELSFTTRWRLYRRDLRTFGLR